MIVKLECTLETAMFRAMQEKKYSAAASNAKVLMKLIDLEAKKYNFQINKLVLINYE